MFQSDDVLFSDYELFITPFQRKRDMPMIYALNGTKQLILKNFHSDGITIVGTDESIRRFLDSIDDESYFNLAGAGFYPWEMEVI